MSEHMPECDVQFLGSEVCICPELRACEQRIARLPHHEAIYADGYAAGVRAARDAVAAVRPWSLGVVKIDKHDALAAIDALKEKP